jgi:hypothetical protein
VSAPCPIAGIAFLATGNELTWVKSCPPFPRLGLHVSVTAYADYAHDRATLGVSLGGSHLPGVPVPIREPLPAPIPVPSGTHATCAAIHVTSAGPVEIFAILLPGRFVRVGRNRLWRLRDEYAQPLPAEIRTLLTRRRALGV